MADTDRRLAGSISDEILYGRPSDHLKVFVSSHMRGGLLSAERGVTIDAIDGIGITKSWAWENDARAGPYSARKVCVAQAATSDGLVLLIGDRITPITKAKYYAARRSGVPPYIMVREGEALNPYRPGTVPALVKLEEENFAADGSRTPIDLRALAISPKRYVLYELGAEGPVLRKASEHGLGLYRPPIPNPVGWSTKWRYWVGYVWDSIIREAEGLPQLPEPAWYDLPALSQLTITSPPLLAPFRTLNAGRQYRDQVKPFGFMMVGHVDALAPLPYGLLLDRLMPIAPYTAQPAEFLALPWVNRVDGNPIRVTTRSRGEQGMVRLKTYRDVIREYRTHPDIKSGDPDGGQGHRGSRGLLPRLHVEVTEVHHIVKESNRLDEEDEGAVLEADEVYVEYRDEREEWLRVTAPRLRDLQKEIGAAALREASGLSERALRDALNLRHCRGAELDALYWIWPGLEMIRGTMTMGRGPTQAAC